MLEHGHHRVPVTALAFVPGHEVIIAGEGSILKFYDADTGNILASLSIFKDQVIHGIVLAPDHVSAVVWGGPLFTKLSISIANDGLLRPSSTRVAKAPDWILDAAFAPQLSIEVGYELAIITAHNAVLFPSVREPGGDQILSNSTDATSDCILYSAHLSWLNPSRLLVASGTAFGDVLVWSCYIQQDDAGYCSRKSKIHYTFSAHEGSVFGVQISASVTLPQAGGDSYLLATCSDDRTIKVWDISDFLDQESIQTQQQRDTGFGQKHVARDITPRCLAKTLGHVSRIWHVQFLAYVGTFEGALYLRDATSHVVSIMSFGEDATCISWSMKVSPNSTMPFALMQNSVDLAHVGKHIWSVATNAAGQVCTGGADGTIAVRSRNLSNRNASEIQKDQISESDNIRSYAYVGNSLVGTTDQGRIILISPDVRGGREMIQTISPEVPGLRGYSLVTSMHKTAVIAGTDGAIYLYQQDTAHLLHLTRTSSKVAGLYMCHAHSGIVFLLATSVTSCTATMYSWLEQSAADLDGDDLVEDERRLEIPKGFVVTSFCVVQGEGHRLIAVLGSREGALLIFGWRQPADDSLPPAISIIEGIHGAEAVTGLHCQAVYKWNRRIVHLYSTGRDGTQAVHELDYTDGCVILERIHQLPLPFGPNIEGLALIDHTLLVWGFKGKQFIVYDTSNQRQVMTVDCGGSHRQWAFRPNVLGGSFFWTKAMKQYHITQTEPDYNLLNDGGHGREIKAVSVCPGDTQIIATGSEDTNIKLFTMTDTGFECQRTLRRHITGIQILRWSDDGAYLFSSGGYEEFFVWRIHKDCSNFELGVVCESSHPNNRASDLRIMNFDITSSNAGHVVTMAYSNSVLKRWLYSRSGGWTLLASGDYLTACLTHVQHLRNPDMLFSTATDGHLTLWSLLPSGALSWQYRQQIHQSSILSVAMHRLPDESTLVVTGGDDNAIGLTILRPSKCGQAATHYPVFSSLLIPRAHTAAVTGVVLRAVTATQLSLTSGSIDQRVKTWQIDIAPDMADVESLRIEKIKDVGTDVADVSCLAVVGHKVLVVGVGMDLH
nr:putative wd repeat-containing protein [Quercus suber]